MRIEKVNDTQIRCTLTKEDLAERQIKISELAYGSEKAKELCPKYSVKLTEQQEKLNSISSAISVLNLTNMELIKHGMILADKKLNIIIDACAPKGNSYSKSGKEETSNLEMSTIIQEA